MREDNVATEIANAFSEGMNACAMLAAETWKGQRDAILDGVSWFVEAAPLVDLPNVAGPKDTIRRAAAIAGRVKDAVSAWDGTTDPPDTLVALAREFLACVGMPV